MHHLRKHCGERKLANVTVTYEDKGNAKMHQIMPLGHKRPTCLNSLSLVLRTSLCHNGAGNATFSIDSLQKPFNIDSVDRSQCHVLNVAKEKDRST